MSLFLLNIDSEMTPSLRKYLRDRKPFTQLKSPDFSSPRRLRMNVRYGKDTVMSYRKKVNRLQTEISRLKKKMVTLQDLIGHLEEQNKISATLSNKFLVCVCKI